MESEELKEFKHQCMIMDESTINKILLILSLKIEQKSNIDSIDNEKTLFMNKGYLDCARDLKRQLDNILTVKKST